jgi:hypothetical protein
MITKAKRKLRKNSVPINNPIRTHYTLPNAEQQRSTPKKMEWIPIETQALLIVLREILDELKKINQKLDFI